MSANFRVKFDFNSGLDSVIHVWNMSSKTHNILQQTCVFLSSHHKSDEQIGVNTDEEIGHVCWNVRILFFFIICELSLTCNNTIQQVVKDHYSQTGCSFDGNSAMLWRNVPILMGSLLDTTCNIQFKFARASCQVPVFDIPELKVIIPPLFQRSGK